MPQVPVIDLGEAETLDRSNPVVPARTLWSLVLLLAVKRMATVVRFEPHRGRHSLTYRRNGSYHQLMSPPRHMTLDLIGEIEGLIEAGGWKRRWVPWFGWLRRNRQENGDEEVTRKCLVELKVADQTVDAIVVVEPTIFSKSVIFYLVDSSPPFRARSMASRRAARLLKRIFSDWKKSKEQGQDQTAG